MIELEQENSAQYPSGSQEPGATPQGPKRPEPASVVWRQMAVSGLATLSALLLSYWYWVEVLSTRACLWLFGATTPDEVAQVEWVSCIVIGPFSVVRLGLALTLAVVAATAVWVVGSLLGRRGSWWLALLATYVMFGMLSLYERVLPQTGSLPVSDATLQVALIATLLSGVPACLGYYFRRIVVGDNDRKESPHN